MIDTEEIKRKSERLLQMLAEEDRRVAQIADLETSLGFLRERIRDQSEELVEIRKKLEELK